MGDIGLLLKNRRIELNLTLKEVAEFVGVSESTVSRWETGNIANMKSSRISQLSKILNIPPTAIMGIFDQQKENKMYSLTQDEQQTITLYRKLDTEDKAEIRGTMKGMLKAEKYTDNAESKLQA